MLNRNSELVNDLVFKIKEFLNCESNGELNSRRMYPGSKKRLIEEISRIEEIHNEELISQAIEILEVEFST